MAKADQRPRPLYWRILRLRVVRPGAITRVFLVEGLLAVAVLMMLAEAASAWSLVVLPAVGMAIVKAHDLLAVQLGASAAHPPSRAEHWHSRGG